MTLTKMKIKNFRRFNSVEIELGNPVVFIGPNNSGKTSALQALALWSIGLRKWIERREGGRASKRTGVTINRRELISIPLLRTNSLWRSLRVRKGNTPIRIEVIVEGVAQDSVWTCGLEFDSVDQENIRCRPIGQRTASNGGTAIPEGARKVRVAFLPPMSGLTSQEDLLQIGSIERRIGEGRTADVLRNLCYQVWEKDHADWTRLTGEIKKLFGVDLHEPVYDRDTGTLFLEYIERQNVTLDLTASGQGFRQTLLLLAYLYANPGAVMLLDEPDAHLEILRQRQIYQVLVDVASRSGSQIIIATHSEVVLNEAAQRDVVVAFVGQPHLVSRDSQVRRALAEYGFDDYYQAEETGWVLYLEGATDLAILKALAERLGNKGATTALERPFVHYVANQPPKAHQHFFAMREAFPDLSGIALFDNLPKGIQQNPQLEQLMWERREIENYLAFPEVLIAYAQGEPPTDLFAQKRKDVMDELVRLYIPPIALQDRNDRWWFTTKMSDDFLDRLFEEYYKRLGLPNEMQKANYHRLTRFMPKDMISVEVAEKLNSIAAVARAAKRRLRGRRGASQIEESVDGSSGKEAPGEQEDAE